MIESAAAVRLVRDELRTEILPLLGGNDYARSVLNAALGVLGEVAARVCDDSAWCAPSVAEMEAASISWSARLHRWPDCAVRVCDLVGRAAEAPDLGTKRTHLLHAAEVILTTLWTTPPDGDSSALRHELLVLVEADAEREIAATA